MRSALAHRQDEYTPAAWQRSDWLIWLQWTLAVALGELLGFAIPALTGALAWAWGVPDRLTIGLLIVAGLGEGAVLGFAQWLVLRRYLGGVRGRDWVLATALAAGVAWVIGMIPSNIGDLSALDQRLLISLVVLGAVIFLLVMGSAQWLVLRRHLLRAAWWIPANMLAWPLGVAVPVVALSLLPDTSTPLLSGIVGVASGMLMGLVVGTITGIALVNLLRANARPLPH